MNLQHIVLLFALTCLFFESVHSKKVLSCLRTEDGKETCEMKAQSGETEDDDDDDDDDDEPTFLENRREPLTQWDPVKVGHQRKIEIEPGYEVTMTTLAMRPRLFAIPNFLTDEECEQIIDIAEDTGMFSSGLHIDNHYRDWKAKNQGITSTMFTDFSNIDTNGDQIITIEEIKKMIQITRIIYLTDEQVESMFNALEITEFGSHGNITRKQFDIINAVGKMAEMENYLRFMRENDPVLRDRHSEQTWLTRVGKAVPLMRKIRSKIVKLTGLPRYIVEGSEPLQVLRYTTHGHYHAHFDSQFLDKDGHENMSCCHFDDTGDARKCKLCRFITLAYYLNDVEEGGETAFPVADKPNFNLTSLEYNRGEGHDPYNLVQFCDTANVVVKPKRGQAVMWYNYHLADDGWMGKMDEYSLHGGCELRKGEKWFANNWLPAPPSGMEHLDSVNQYY